MLAGLRISRHLLQTGLRIVAAETCLRVARANVKEYSEHYVLSVRGNKYGHMRANLTAKDLSWMRAAGRRLLGAMSKVIAEQLHRLPLPISLALTRTRARYV
ncbi:hypothetical protein COCC4DRAFT_135660 [Bipolaris maydis ATCC 48331]|uniref:Uncharacterized protein n=1 Tax=Cochliobolus heterostrophus (strain C4 / ATCC 48331 / race T) TaxID=665024 RepID=N4X011_COCH4|nr:uncharacterized protein COCC4DRAFT_135660 [Bipolaris maydis ATCC 48331]ENI06294.1 hypothetical protein COCC4DRAFT_135660 [Bipolaris maydis ATCC 48331]